MNTESVSSAPISLAPQCELSKLVGHTSTPPPDAILVLKEKTKSLSEQPGTFFHGNLHGRKLVILPDIGISNSRCKGLCYASMLFEDFDLMENTKVDEDVSKYRTTETICPNRDMDKSSVWEGIGTTTATTTLDYAPKVYKLSYSDACEAEHTYLDVPGVWSLADRAGVVAIDVEKIIPMLEQIVHKFCSEMLTKAIDHDSTSQSWDDTLERILPYVVTGLRSTLEWPGYQGMCCNPEPILPSVDLETAYQMYTAKNILSKHYFPQGSNECATQFQTVQKRFSTWPRWLQNVSTNV